MNKIFIPCLTMSLSDHISDAAAREASANPFEDRGRFEIQCDLGTWRIIWTRGSDGSISVMEVKL